MALSKVNMLGLKDERYIIEHAKLLWASGNQRQVPSPRRQVFVLFS